MGAQSGRAGPARARLRPGSQGRRCRGRSLAPARDAGRGDDAGGKHSHAVRRARCARQAKRRRRTAGATRQGPAPSLGRRRPFVTDDGCRIDVWLWRARFFKTRSLAARIVEDGGVRLARGGARAPIEKPSRAVRCGDVLTFAQGPRWLAVKVEALGARRGPAPEARALYSLLPDSAGAATA